MRKYMETGFYVAYFVVILTAGILLSIRGSKERSRRYLLFFGAACAILGFGDAFHLVPRAIGLLTGTLDAPSASLATWLGVGKLVTSLTMTAFYVLFYLFIYKKIGKKRPLWLDIVVGVLTLARGVLCAFPQNGWLTNESPLVWGICRNIPFTLLGVIVIVLCATYLRKIKPYRLLFSAIILSFGFYLPVVLVASKYAWVGMLMIPKTVCYLWIAGMGLADGFRREA